MTHVFVSYMRDDTPVVERLCDDLRERGVEIWIDREKILPGQRWQDAIRSAIEGGAFFLARFSESYLDREKSYMNEELNLAVEQMRLRSRNRQWMIPIKLSICEIPHIPISPGETLRSIQWVDLSKDWGAGISELSRVLSTELTDIPFVFMSGSKVLAKTSGAEIKHFRDICQTLGETIAELGFGIVGCPSHRSRALASQEARLGAQRINPKFKFCDAAVKFPLDASERERFVRLASGAVFVGGGHGTLDEFELCVDAGLAPLIPVAGCGGSGARLARRTWSLDGKEVEASLAREHATRTLLSESKKPRDYADAVRALLTSRTLDRKPKSLFKRLLSSRKGERAAGDWLPSEYRSRRGILMGNQWHGPYGEMLWFDGKEIHYLPPESD